MFVIEAKQLFNQFSVAFTDKKKLVLNMGYVFSLYEEINRDGEKILFTHV